LKRASRGRKRAPARTAFQIDRDTVSQKVTIARFFDVDGKTDRRWLAGQVPGPGMAAAMRLFALLAQDGRVNLYVLHQDGEVEIECGCPDEEELRAAIEREVRAELAERALPPAPPHEEPLVVAEAPTTTEASAAPHTEALLRSLGVGLPEPAAPAADPEPAGAGLVRIRWRDGGTEDVPPARAARVLAHVDLVDTTPEQDAAVLAAFNARTDAEAERLRRDGLLAPGAGVRTAPDKFNLGRL
jgi:hypothetical protein